MSDLPLDPIAEEIAEFFDVILKTYEPALKVYVECLETLDPPPRVYTSDRTDGPYE